MREIKFRAWNKKTGMTYFKELVIRWLQYPHNKNAFKDIEQIELQSGNIVNNQRRLDSSICDAEKEDFKLMQSTGLTDKNGKEIYEGDIVRYETNYYRKHKTHITAIEWSEDLEHDGFGEPLAIGYIFRGYNIEIIGNIYENKDLLEQKWQADFTNTKKYKQAES